MPWLLVPLFMPWQVLFIFTLLLANNREPVWCIYAVGTTIVICLLFGGAGYTCIYIVQKQIAFGQHVRFYFIATWMQKISTLSELGVGWLLFTFLTGFLNTLYYNIVFNLIILLLESQCNHLGRGGKLNWKFARTICMDHLRGQRCVIALLSWPSYVVFFSSILGGKSVKLAGGRWHWKHLGD